MHTYDCIERVKLYHIMLFTTTKVVILLSIIYHTCGNDNVALNKPATQSSTLGVNTAGKAVNGQTNDFSHTEAGGLSKWWTVDLLARYSIESITLYNRPGLEYRLAKISILTSTVLSPADPYPTHSNWTIRNYREEAYGSIGTVSFDLPIRAQHVAVYMENLDAPLTLVEVEVSGVAVNLALNKPARQISNLSSAYSAGKAVNGNINDFSHTAEGDGNKWWTVDLQARYSIESISLYNRQGRVDLHFRLAKISILTSTVLSPTDPDLNHSDWAIINYREEAYGSSGSVSFDPPNEAQHVAVYSENFREPLALAEVQVYGDYNYAFGKAASQSSTFGGQSRSDLAADKAIDGDLITYSVTNFNQPNNAWWKVDLVDRILLREVTVYVRDELCGPIGARVDCSSRLSDVYFLTNYRAAGAAPRPDGVADWSICYHSETSLGNKHTVQCDTGYQNPVTRLFSIRTNAGISVELREVHIFGYELPELSGDIAIAAEQITTGSITITFSQWNQQMAGELPPTQYKVQLSGGENETVPHNTSSQRLSTTFNGLDPGQTYTFTVSCTIQGIACTGSIHYIDVSLCAVPDAPGVITLTENAKETHNSRQMWKYSAVWIVPSKANCSDVLEYQYSVTGQSPSALQTTTTSTFYLDGDLPFEFVVRAKNSQGYSTPTSKSGVSGVLKPQFTAGQVSVTGKSSYCVTVTWETPTYPGGTITQYQYQCGSEGRQTVQDGIRSKDSCNYEPNTEVNCTVWATNSAGDGSIQNSGKTLCAVPPPEFTLSSFKSDNFTASLNISVKALQGTCAVNGIYRIRVRQPDGSLVHNQTTTTSGSYIINNLYGFTNYTVTIEVVNNEGSRSESTQYIVTVETLPLDGPRLELSFTEDCVLLHLQPPQTPNGEIQNYQYRCAEVDGQLKASLPVLAQDIEAAFIPSWCGFPQAIQVVCETYAVTNVGESPTTTTTGYTNAAVASSVTAQLIPPTETKSEMVVINIHPVQLEDSTLHISSYLVLLRNRTSAGVQRSTEEKCDVNRQNCKLIAEVNSELVTADGYWFYIGDGRIYGGYVNSALVPKSSYSVQIAISVQLPEGGVTFYQSLDDELSFTAPSSYCQPPPTVQNAIAESTSNATIGDTVEYTCEYGYQTAGDNKLTCALTESYESDWVGSDVICDNESQKQNWIVGVSAGIAAFVLLAVGIAIAVVIIKKRTHTPAGNGNDPVEPMELSDYMHPPAATASNYTERNVGEEVNVSKPDDACEYDTIAMDTKPGDEYETIPADVSTSDHVSASC